jgi:polyisoprenoid-binding protein YceI
LNGNGNATSATPSGGRRRQSGQLDSPSSFQVVPERAAVVLLARSNAGPITFGTTGIEGWIEAEVADGAISLRVPPLARLEIPIDRLTSGNEVYDAELKRRVNARVYPTAGLELRAATPIGSTGRYHVNGELTFHGVTREMAGTVAVSFPQSGRMVVEGEHVIDMRPFDITPPTVAILRIYPDVRVRLHLEASVEA